MKVTRRSRYPWHELADPTHPEYTLHGLSDTETSFLVLTAYDSDNNESGFSNEVSYQPPAAPTLSSLSISGDSSVNENSSASYTATAAFSDGSTQIVSGSAAWSDNSSYASINNSGVLTTMEVPADTAVTIQASYTIDGITETATIEVDVADVYNPPTLSSLSISGDSSVNENSSASYTATAAFSDGSTQIVSGSAAWSDNSSYASINNSGVLTTIRSAGRHGGDHPGRLFYRRNYQNRNKSNRYNGCLCSTDPQQPVHQRRQFG